jgi:hypothetical protein
MVARVSDGMWRTFSVRRSSSEWKPRAIGTLELMTSRMSLTLDEWTCMGLLIWDGVTSRGPTRAWFGVGAARRRLRDLCEGALSAKVFVASSSGRAHEIIPKSLGLSAAPAARTSTAPPVHEVRRLEAAAPNGSFRPWRTRLFLLRVTESGPR